MRVRRLQSNRYLRDREPSCRGFTLVELIVVLTIVAILAAVGVVSLVGYINKSHFDENSRNAVTVYQAAQNAIAAKTASGTADEWTRSVMQNVTHNDFTSAEISGISDVNDSYHKTIALTFNPRASLSEGSEDQALYDLLSPYFYDPSVFSGTMAVELDVSVTRDSDGTDLYSARVIAAYYSKQNTANSGWDAKCTNTENIVAGRLPETDLAYRQSKSYVGYFDGTEASIAGPVSLPQDQMNSDYIFTLRNSETLDVTWGFFNNPGNNAEFDIRLHDINSTDSLGVGDVIIHINEQTVLSNAESTLSSSRNVFECIKYESGFTAWPKLEVQDGYTQISVKRVVAGATAGSVTMTDAVEYVVPFSVTRVTRDTRANTPDDYYTYTISLDCLMTRASYSNVSASAYNNILLSKRLFNTDDPKNISAHIENGSIPGATISESYATRAVDDPIYFTELKVEGPADGADQQIRYCYDITSARAGYDTADYCVVNTLFGDLECTDLNGQTISGSYSGAAGGKAVITSFRHLSNIRRIGTTPVDFKIARDLNWFNNVGNVLLSEVKVFASGGSNTFVYHSPVENGVAKIVSFPAIQKLNAGQSLSSLSTDTGDENSVIVSINRVQMRKASFANNDTCYGLICDNYGTVYNIYTNNINIVAVDLADGSDSDYSKNNRNSICPTIAISIDVNGGTRPLENYNNNDFQRPMGGLIGWNHGTVGLQGESVDNGQNTIKMSNCIVMSSKYWSIYNNNSKAPAGGIIGRNENNVYGLLVVNGSFAVVNRDMVGGVIGLANHDVSARLVVDGTSDGRSDFTLPAESHNGGRNLSCVLASKNVAGGAIGSFSYAGKNFTYEMNSPDVDFNAGIYDIDVMLPADSMIISVVGYHDEGVGGAIGTMYKVKGDSLDIRVDNYGRIITLNTSTQKSPDLHFAGGVIGFESECTIATTNITAYNHAGTEIGSCTATTGATSAGGVYGKLYYRTNTVRTFNITVIDEGVITARGEGRNENNKFEGAGGCIGSLSGGGTVLLNIDTTLQSGASVASYVNDAGGAIGYNGNSIQGSVSATINGSTVYGLTDATNNIGGVIGRNNANSSAAISAFLSSDSTIRGCNYVGGAIGLNVSGVSNSVTVTVAGAISGANHVGGVIGRNEKSLSGTFTSTVSGSITGGQYVGGIIGSKAVTAISGTYTAVVDGSISGTEYIGGAIGYNDYGVSGTVTTTIGGSVTGTGNYVAGAIGYNTATITASITTSVNGTVSGASYVGGAVGYNNKILAAITTNVTGNITGTADIGGAIGHNEYNNNSASITGAVNVEISGNITGTGNNVAGVIGYSNATLNNSISATVSGNISGAERIGGIIGYNNKDISCPMTINMNGNVTGTTSVGGAVAYANASMSGTITVTFGTAYPVNGTTSVGGVIGIIVNGTVNDIVVNGTGGTVNLTTPSRTYRNSILVAGSGDHIGGIIGIIGTGSSGSNATVKNISVSNVGLCVTSGDNALGVGGWIGTCCGTIGANNSYVTYDINTVKCVYSRGNSHGGFCGIADYKNGNSKSAIYANIHMTLSNAAIVGISEVGGVFGRMNGVDYRGEMTVSLMSNTRIGDAAGTITADGTMYTDGCFCIEAGGAVGYASHNATITGGKIAVEFWDTSKIFAGGNSGDNAIPELNAAGVGGAFGSIGNASNNITTDGKSTKPEIGSSSYNISVLSPSSSPCICSNVSNAGGVVGMVYTGVIKYSYSTAVVYNNISSGADATATGGLVGKLQRGFIQYCYVGGHTVGGQYVTGEDNVTGRKYVGGLVGYTGDNTYIDHCYSTASVRGLQYVGGFLGATYCSHFLQLGDINNCYSTGRVTGNSNTGIFAGYVDVNNSLYNAVYSNCNKVLKFINLINPGMRLIGNINDTTATLGNLCLYADAGGPGNGGIAKINVDGASYAAHPYDGYLAGNGSNINYPMRAFVNNTHYGDWPVQPGNVNIANAATSVEIANPSYTYNGTVVTIPDGDLTVALNGTLTQGTDYYVDYVNNEHAGVATVRIFGIGNYTGMITRDFTIDPANIESIEFTSTVNIPDEGYCYIDSEITPSVTVTYGDVTLEEGIDYELSYENNINAGSEATVTISGIGDYTGTVSRTFTIDAVNLDFATITITDEGPFLYAGEDINPNIVVNVNGMELTCDTDYVVEYVDCDGPNRTGRISITAVPDSNYVSGSGTFIEFDIGAQTYNVEFYDAENGNIISSAEVEYGSSVTAPDVPSVDGQEFVAWYSDGTAFDFETQVTRDIIIYATWQEVNQDTDSNDPNNDPEGGNEQELDPNADPNAPGTDPQTDGQNDSDEPQNQSDQNNQNNEGTNG